MKMLVYFSIIYLSLISCTKKNDNTFINPVAAVDTIHKTYLALGDSYTIGQSVPDTGRFPVQTVKLLREQNIQVANPDIIAVTGWATGNLLNSLNTKPPKNNYSIVTLLIGVNNQYQNRSLEEYKSQFTELLNRAIFYAGNNKNHIVVLSIPDYSVTPFASGSGTERISGEIDNFNEANKAISLNAGVHYLDITPISREAKNDPSLIAGDGLHPSSIQYKRWSSLLVKMIMEKIR